VGDDYHSPRQKSRGKKLRIYFLRVSSKTRGFPAGELRKTPRKIKSAEKEKKREKIREM